MKSGQLADKYPKRTMNKHLISKADFEAILDRAGKSEGSGEGHTKAWLALADLILADWNGVSFSFLKALTPGQYAVTCAAEFYRGIKGQDLITVISTSEELPTMTLKAFEILEAQEYLDLWKQVEAVFPKKQFPKYSEDILWAVRKQPHGYFDNAGEKFLTGKGMKRPLHDYVFGFVTANPEDFCAAGSNSP